MYKQRMAFDLETKSNNPISTDKKFRPCTRLDDILLITCMAPDNTKHIWDMTRNETPPDWFFNLLEDKDTLSIAHNLSFDSKFIKRKYGVKTNNPWCSMVSEALLNMGDRLMRNGLDVVLKRRYGVTLDKSIRDNFKFGIVGDREREYALNDITYLFPLQADQEREIARAGMNNAARIENQLSYIIGQIEDYGMPFDVDQYLQQLEQVYILRSQAAKAVNDLMGIDYMTDFIDDSIVDGTGLPLNSSAKCIRALAEYGLILPEVYDKKKDKKVTKFSEGNLVTYLYKSRDKHLNNIVLAILEYKKWDKALTWGYEKIINPATGRIHASINQLVSTSRVSYRDPNLQQVSNAYAILTLQDDGKFSPIYSDINYRANFSAPEGWQWVGADKSQIELRLYGDMAGVQSIIDEYAKGPFADLHSQAARMMFGLGPDDIVSKLQRQAGKPGNFGARTFGGGPNALINAALSYGMLLEWEQAAELRDNLIMADPEGIEWGRAMIEQVREYGHMYTRAGHRRLFISEEDRKETTARNTPIQGTAAGMMKESMIGFYNWVESRGYLEDVQILSTVHDELNSICRQELTQEVEYHKARIMTESINQYMEVIPGAVDVGSGPCWKKEYDNQEMCFIESGSPKFYKESKSEGWVDSTRFN